MKHVKLYFISLGVVIVVGILGYTGQISLSTKDNKIAENTELRNMFHRSATRSEEHQKSAEQNWMDKYFNVKF